MRAAKLRNTRILGGFILYTSIILFIGSYFDLEVSTSVLLQALKSNLLVSALFGILLAAIDEWAIRRDKNLDQG